MNLSGDTALSISLVVLLFGLFTNFYGLWSGRKKDIKTDTLELSSIRESLIKVDIKTGQLMSSTDEIKTDVKKINDRIVSIEKDVVDLHNQIDTAFIQIRELREEVKNS